jgi:pectate lyase
MVTSHSASLSGLSAATVYHYRVKSRDAAGNLATSGDFTFTTTGTTPCPGIVIEGFGRNTTGGCGGTVYTVTNLNDSGPGSFRDAVTRTGPRIIKFAVSGDIRLNSNLSIDGDAGNTHGNVTIDGSDAPNGGVCIRSNTGNTGSTFFISADNVIVRNLRFRQGPPRVGQGAVNIIGSNGFFPNNVVFDHCSFSWGQDGNIDTANGATNVTIQWCIIAENSASGATLIRYNNATGISLHHNLWANNASTRNTGTYIGDIDVVNNVIYRNFTGLNFENLTSVAPDGPLEDGGTTGDTIATRVNYVGNHYRAGSNEVSGGNKREIYFYGARSGSPISAVHLSGNISPSRPNATLLENALVEQIGSPSLLSIIATRFNFPAVTTTSAAQALTDVLAGAGAKLPCRDAVDARIVAYVTSSTGAIASPGAGGNPSLVGGWPNLTQACVP